MTAVSAPPAFDFADSAEAFSSPSVQSGAHSLLEFYRDRPAYLAQAAAILLYALALGGLCYLAKPKQVPQDQPIELTMVPDDAPSPVDTPDTAPTPPAIAEQSPVQPDTPPVTDPTPPDQTALATPDTPPPDQDLPAAPRRPAGDDCSGRPAATAAVGKAGEASAKAAGGRRAFFQPAPCSCGWWWKPRLERVAVFLCQ